MTILARLLEQLPTPLVLVDLAPDPRIVVANPAFVKAFGYRRDELVADGAWWMPANLESDPGGQSTHSLAKSVENARLAGDRAQRLDGHIRARDGTCCPVRLGILIMEDQAVLSFEECQTPSPLEGAVQNREALFHAFFNLPLVGTAITSAEKGWIEVNDRTCEILGYSRQALFRKNWAELTHPDDLAADVALFEQMLAGEIDSYSLEKRFIRPDGSAVPCLLIGGRSRRSEITAEFFYVQIIDLSERKQIEDALRTAQQALLNREVERTKVEERERLMEEIHDGFGSLLATTRLKVEKGRLSNAQVADLLKDSMDDLHAMVDTLSQGETQLKNAVVNLRHRLQVGLQDTAPLLRWRIELDALPPLPQRTILQCIRILQEAIANAIKHAQSRAIDIDCVLAEGILRLTVRDDGIGLTEKPRQGRGLANLARRARKLGATLDLQSGPSGVTLTLLLPLEDEARRT